MKEVVLELCARTCGPNTIESAIVINSFRISVFTFLR